MSMSNAEALREASRQVAYIRNLISEFIEDVDHYRFPIGADDVDKLNAMASTLEEIEDALSELGEG